MATVRQLKDELFKKGLSTRGNKAVLIKRLALASTGDNSDTAGDTCSICQKEAIVATSVKEDNPSSLIKSSTNAIVKTLQDEEIYAEQVGDTEVIGNAKGINLAHIRANQESTIAYLEEKFRTLEEKLKNDNKRLSEMFRKENDRLKEELQDTRESLETRLEDIQSAAYILQTGSYRFSNGIKNSQLQRRTNT